MLRGLKCLNKELLAALSNTVSNNCCKVGFTESTSLMCSEKMFNRVSAISTFGERTKNRFQKDLLFMAECFPAHLKDLRRQSVEKRCSRPPSFFAAVSGIL